MAIQIRTVETEPFEWTWPEDPDVVCMLRPATPEIERDAARASKLTIQMELMGLADNFYEHAARVLISWAGVEGDGEPLRADRAGLLHVSLHAPELVIAIVQASKAKYAELVELAGKSSDRPSGSSSTESTATASRQADQQETPGDSLPRAI